MPKGFYLTGGWGYGNKGDNAILEGMRQSLSSRFPDDPLTVTSYSQAEMREQHGIESIKSVHRLLWKRAPLGLLRWLGIFVWRATDLKVLLVPSLRKHQSLMRQARAVIMGGGGYFNDAWPDMLRSRYVEIDLARSVGTPVVIYGQTLGPFSKTTIDRSLGRYLGYVAKIAFRDAQSLKVLEAAGVPEKKRVLSADEANLLSVRPPLEPKRAGRKVVGVMIQKFRPHLGPSGPSPAGSIPDEGSYVQRVVEALGNVASKNPDVDYLFIPSTRWDESTVRRVADELRTKIDGRIQFISDPTADQFIRSCQNVDLMVSTNMHPIILAATAGVPSVAISYHYKLDDFMVSIGLEKYTQRIDDFSALDLSATINTALINLETNSTGLKGSHSSVQNLAKNNARILFEAVN